MIRFCKECDNPMDAEDAHVMRINPCTCEVDQYGGYTVEGVTGEREDNLSCYFSEIVTLPINALNLATITIEPIIVDEFDPITEEEEYLVNDYDDDIERPTIEFTEVKCECGADAAKTGFHSSWCPKYVKL